MGLKYLVTWTLLYLSLGASDFIAEDKTKHVLAGTVIYLGCLVVADINSIPHKYCLLPVLAAGVGKEVYDNSNGGTAEFSDITATMFIPTTTYIIYTW